MPTSTSPIAGADDQKALAANRVLLQYKVAAPNLNAFIATIADRCQEAANALVTTPTLDDPSIAAGHNLDVTAEIVGQARELLNGDFVTDAQLRLLIQARIARNTSHATGEDLIAGLALIFPGAPIRYFDLGGMTISYLIGAVLTADDVAVLSGDILPRPAGVEINPRAYFDPAAYFGFAEDPNAKGFADDVVRGPGKLAEGF
jgi:hypothetical protein